MPLPETTSRWVDSVQWVDNPRLKPNGLTTLHAIGDAIAARPDFSRIASIFYVVNKETYRQVFNNFHFQPPQELPDGKITKRLAFQPSFKGLFIMRLGEGSSVVNAWTAFLPQQDQLFSDNPQMQYPFQTSFIAGREDARDPSPLAGEVKFLTLMKHLGRLMTHGGGDFFAAACIDSQAIPEINMEII